MSRLSPAHTRLYKLPRGTHRAPLSVPPLLSRPAHRAYRVQILHLQSGPVGKLDELKRQEFLSYAPLESLEMGPQTGRQPGAQIGGGEGWGSGEQVVGGCGEIGFGLERLEEGPEGTDGKRCQMKA